MLSPSSSQPSPTATQRSGEEVLPARQTSAYTVPCSHSCMLPCSRGNSWSPADRNRLEGITWVMESGANTQNKFPEGYRNTHSSNASHCRAQHIPNFPCQTQSSYKRQPQNALDRERESLWMSSTSQVLATLVRNAEPMLSAGRRQK